MPAILIPPSSNPIVGQEPTLILHRARIGMAGVMYGAKVTGNHGGAGAMRVAPGQAVASSDDAPHAVALPVRLDAVHAGKSADASSVSDAAMPLASACRDAIFLDRAVHGLRRKWPELSAASPAAPWQQRAIVVVAGAAAVVASTAPDVGRQAVALALAVPFLMIVFIRILAIAYLLRPTTKIAKPCPSACSEVRNACALPTYSVLVPLYRETAVAANIVAALAVLDYPHDKLEVIFLTEADDAATREALRNAAMTPTMRIVVVPDGEPRTKPRALNFGLQRATGELICIFDAEDVPDPAQLRVAAEAFARDNGRLACVQARLDIYNPKASLWTRQFTIEYAALFEAVLPALGRLGLPLPLGGTSNHFRATHLKDAGGWDPFNVTEDADLGFRFARKGYGVAMIDTTTSEEAPSTARVWLGQRTRWLKGWMQTYLVHMRQPVRLWRDLGPRRFIGFQVTLGGMVLSALVHPWAYVLILAAVMTDTPDWSPRATGLVALCGFNLVVGYGAGIALAVLALRRRGIGSLAQSTIWIPLYWLAISFAAYLAVWDFIRRPYYWEKTPHGAPDVTLPPYSA